MVRLHIRSATAVVPVVCERCGQRVDVQVHGMASAYGSGSKGLQERAVAAARDNVRKLKKTGEPIRCRFCGWLQSWMVWRARCKRAESPSVWLGLNIIVLLCMWAMQSAWLWVAKVPAPFFVGYIVYCLVWWKPNDPRGLPRYAQRAKGDFEMRHGR